MILRIKFTDLDDIEELMDILSKNLIVEINDENMHIECGCIDHKVKIKKVKS